jgi:phage gpG-like protein
VKLTIESNFSFSKLNKNIDEIINNSLVEFAKKTEEGSKNKIDRGLRKLKDVTVKIRKHRGQPERPALKASGNLYRSIRHKDNELEMLFYGKLHNDGFTTGKNSLIPNKKIDPRPFISTTIKAKKEIETNFIKNINKALKK